LSHRERGSWHNLGDASGTSAQPGDQRLNECLNLCEWDGLGLGANPDGLVFRGCFHVVQHKSLNNQRQVPVAKSPKPLHRLTGFFPNARGAGTRRLILREEHSMLNIILLAFALVFAVVAAFVDTVPGPVNIRLGWIALAFLCASLLFR